jgi:O-antigen ligase
VGLAAAWVFKALLLQTWWFSGWLPSLIVAAVLIFIRSRTAFTAVLATAGLIVAVRWDAVYTAVWGTTVSKGDLTRLDIWQQSLDLWQKHPLLGTGPAGYAVYFQNLYLGSRFSFSTHNNYMDVLAETGALGALIFAVFLLTFVWAGWQARQRWRQGFEGAYAQGAFAGLLGLIVAMTQGDWFIPFVYNQTIAGYRYTVHSWVFLGFLACLAAMRHQSEVK